MVMGARWTGLNIKNIKKTADLLSSHTTLEFIQIVGKSKKSLVKITKQEKRSKW